MKTFLLVALMLFTGLAHAGINKWLDENNHVHYSDQPPPANAKARKLAPVADPGTSAASGVTAEPEETEAPKTYMEREAEWRKGQNAKREAAEKAARDQANLDASKANCKNAEHRLKVLQSGIRITDVDDKGERYFLSDEELQRRIASVTSDIGTYCK